MSQWVQHESGQGEKWECDVMGQGPNVWRVKAQSSGVQDYLFLYLPKSEYIEVPGPERWVDVTSECEQREYNFVHQMVGHHSTFTSIIRNEYRLRKVSVAIEGEPGFLTRTRAAFIVERKEP